MAKRIALKNVGETFQLRFTADGFVENQLLVQFGGDLNDLETCRASFREIKEDGSQGFEWEAYRFNKRWCYGTSADILVVVS